MAEGIISSVFTDLLSNLGSTALQEIARIYDAEEEFANLENTFSTLRAVLLDAEQKGDQNLAVKDWLEKLKDAAYDADDLLDELSYDTLRREVISRDKYVEKVRIFFTKNNQLNFRANMVHKMKELRQRLELIADEKTQFQFSYTINDQSGTNDRRDTHSFVPAKYVIGRNEEKEEIVDLLLEINEKQNVSVDAIVGLGGMGKTMLAKVVFDHERVEGNFDLRLWVYISEIFDLKIIVEKIIEAATKQRPSGHGIDTLQHELRNQIDGKKYLLVMDDVWNEDRVRWVELKRLLMGGANGSKILITTRSERVAEVSEATSSYTLNGLSERNSWILFKQMAFKEGEEPESPNMIKMGKEIASKCMGVPLVISTIGGLLYSKTLEEWSSFNNSELATMAQQENEITQALKLSYNHLPSHLKPCFAYCALFSKDHKFKKDELIKLWVAEGFVQPQGERKCLEDVGNEYFMELTRRSLFIDVQRNEYGEIVGCKMHDLMHGLARLVAGAECFAPDSNIKNVNRRTRRVFYYPNDNPCGRLTWEVLSKSLQLCKLRTFFYRYRCELNENKIRLEIHISSHKMLRVLDLPWLDMKKVPISIGMLKHLRFLNLSGNGSIESLPSSITELHFLQTLDLSECSSLRELPEDMESLVNLRHLDNSKNTLKLLPSSITKLQFLQTLNLSDCLFLEKLPEDIGSLVNLRHLYLSNNKSIVCLPDSISNLLHLQKLILDGCTSLSELPKNIGNMVNLRFLDLSFNRSIELLPNSIVKLKKLQLLYLKDCKLLRKLPRNFSKLENITHMDVEGCDVLRDMSIGLNKLVYR